MNSMSSRIGWLLVAALGLAVSIFPNDSRAEEGRKDTFQFQIMPLEFEAFFTDESTGSSKFEEYRDMDGDAVLRRVRLFGESPDKNRTLDFDIVNAGRTDGRYTLRYRNSGQYAVTLDYNLIPHRFGNDGRMLYSNASGPGFLTIADSTQQLLQDSIDAQVALPGPIDFAFLQGQLQPFIDTATIVSPQLERRRARALVDIHKLKRIAWKIDLQQETRDGTRPYGGAFGFNNAIEIPEPIRYNTQDADVSGEWTGKRGGARVGIAVSTFKNSVDSLTYDNPWRITDATNDRGYLAPSSSSLDSSSRARNALAPDNSASQIYLTGHARLGKRGWTNGKLSFGRMEQDDRLLAYTINSAIVPTAPVTAPPPFDASDRANLPVSNADTSVDTIHFTLNAGTKLGDKASVKFRARYYEYDNGSTPITVPGYVRFDSVWEDIGRVTVPYAYTKQKLGVEFGFDPTKKTHVALGFDRLSWDRDFREIEESDEDIIHLSVDSRASKKVTLRGSWEYGDRSTSEYRTEAQLLSFTDPLEEINNLPGLRKFDEAARTYNSGGVSAFIQASDSVNLTLGISVQDQDYGDSEFGLSSDETTAYNVELGYTPHDRFSFFLFGHQSDRESFQQSRTSGGSLSTEPLDNWDLLLSEDTLTLGLGIDGKLSDSWTVRVKGSRSDSNGDSDFSVPVGGNLTVTSFDEYDDVEWSSYSARFAVQAQSNVQAGFTLAREEFDTNRFQRDGVMPYLPGALILDLNDGKYEATIVAFDLRVSF